MPQFDQPLNTQTMDPAGQGQPVPVGWHALQIVAETDLKPVKSGQGKGYQLKYKIVGTGQYVGKEFSEWFCYSHTDHWVQAKSENKLRQLAKACGRQSLRHTQEIFNTTFYGYIGQAENEYVKDGVKKIGINNVLAPGNIEEQILSAAAYKSMMAKKSAGQAEASSGAATFVNNSQAAPKPATAPGDSLPAGADPDISLPAGADDDDAPF